MKQILATLLLVTITLSVFGTNPKLGVTPNGVSLNSSVFTGKVVDSNTGEAIAGVKVKLLGTETSTYTDFDGKYEFKNVSVGAHAVIVQSMTYQQNVTNVYLSNDKVNELVIKLNSK